MKILHLMPYSPVPPNFGGALRTYNILKNIIKKCEVSLVLFGSENSRKIIKEEFGGSIKDIFLVSDQWERNYKRLAQVYSTFSRHSCFHLQAVNKPMQHMLDRILDQNTFDIVQTEFSHLGSYDLKTEAVKVLDAHNVEYDNFRRMWINTRSPHRRLYYYMEFKKLYAEEIEGCQKQDALFVTSERDKELFSKSLSNVPMYVIPNGVDATYFTPSENQPEPYSLVFTGMMGYVPNYDGVLYFLDEIFPIIKKRIPQVKIYIVGNRPPKHLCQRASDNIIITGYTDDVRPFINRGSVYVVPLRMGSGTRLKIAEALSMKKPIVTTSVGCEGINVVSGESALIADTPSEFAESVIRLLGDESLRRKLITNGYELMRTTYEWSVIGEKIQEHYQLLLRERKARCK
jgi:polysaccharide biosynthesis protein PslH